MLQQCREVASSGMTKKDGEEIMKVFRKYTTYEDLRDLYQKCVPAISVQEGKLQEMRNEVAR